MKVTALPNASTSRDWWREPATKELLHALSDERTDDAESRDLQGQHDQNDRRQQWADRKKCTDIDDCEGGIEDQARDCARKESAHGVDLADAGQGLSHLPSFQEPQRKVQDVPEDTAGEFRRQPVGHVVSEIGRKSAEGGRKERGQRHHRDDQHESCLPLEGEHSIDESLENERLHEAQEPQHHGKRHELDDQMGVTPRRPGEPREGCRLVGRGKIDGF